MKTILVGTCLACFAMVYGTQAASLETLDDLEVSMPGTSDQAADAVYLFGINVNQGGKEWITRHRYNDCRVLKDKLGPEAESLPDAPFPAKLWWPWPTESMLVERRKGLEKWLQQVLEHPNIKESWKEPLQEFLHEEAVVDTYEKDKLLNLAKTANDNVYSGWQKTATKLGEWYERGLAHCENDAKCKAAKDRFENMKKTITSKTEEVKEGMQEAKVLSDKADAARAHLEKLQETTENEEEVKAAEDKLETAEEKALDKLKEMEKLKDDVEELEENAETAMEKSLESTMVNTEL